MRDSQGGSQRTDHLLREEVAEVEGALKVLLGRKFADLLAAAHSTDI